jgi:hypothetical protein
LETLNIIDNEMSGGYIRYDEKGKIIEREIIPAVQKIQSLHQIKQFHSF